MFLPSQLSSASRSRSTLSWLQIGTILQPQILKTLVNLFKLLIYKFLADFQRLMQYTNACPAASATSALRVPHHWPLVFQAGTAENVSLS